MGYFLGKVLASKRIMAIYVTGHKDDSVKSRKKKFLAERLED